MKMRFCGILACLAPLLGCFHHALSGLEHPYDIHVDLGAAVGKPTLLDPITQPGADQNRNGIVNRLEYPLRVDSSSGTLLVSSYFEEIEGVRNMMIRYPVNSLASPDYYEITPQVSADLVEWQGPDGSLGLIDELDPNQEPSLPETQWRRARVAAPIGGPPRYLRIHVLSLAEVARFIREQQAELKAAIDLYAIQNNLAGDDTVCWDCLLFYLAEDSPLRETGPIDRFGNPFVFQTIEDSPQMHPDTIARLRNGLEDAVHVYTPHAVAELIQKEADVLFQATMQFAIENNKALESPVSWADIQPYVSSSSRLQESGARDLFGNSYIIGPTIADGAAVAPATLQRLEDAGLFAEGVLIEDLSPLEIVDQIENDLRLFGSALDQYRIENSLADDDPTPALNLLLDLLDQRSSLARRDGLDPLGNPYVFGATLSAGIRLHPNTLQQFSTEWPDIANRAIAVQAGALIAKDIENLRKAYLATFDIYNLDLDAPLSWAILKPNISSGAADLLGRDGVDPLGRAYLIGPAVRNFLRLDPASYAFLVTHGVRPDPQQVLANNKPYSPTEVWNPLRNLQSALDEWAITKNLTEPSAIDYAEFAALITESAIVERGGTDIFDNEYARSPAHWGAYLSHDTFQIINADAGWSRGNLCRAAHWMAADLEAAADLLEAWRTDQSLPTTAAVSWEDIPAAFTQFFSNHLDLQHRNFGYDSLGNRPQIGPTFQDGVRINPVSEQTLIDADLWPLW